VSMGKSKPCRHIFKTATSWAFPLPPGVGNKEDAREDTKE